MGTEEYSDRSTTSPSFSLSAVTSIHFPLRWTFHLWESLVTRDLPDSSRTDLKQFLEVGKRDTVLRTGSIFSTSSSSTPMVSQEFPMSHARMTSTQPFR